MIGAIFVNAAGGRSIKMFLQERTFEEYLAAGTAAIAFALTKGESGDDLIFTKVCADETTNLALRLAGAKLGILDGARTPGCDETFF